MNAIVYALAYPQKGEKEQEFVSTCIKYVTKNERERWPNPKQRDAICYSQWREADNKDYLAENGSKKENK